VQGCCVEYCNDKTANFVVQAVLRRLKNLALSAGTDTGMRALVEELITEILPQQTATGWIFCTACEAVYKYHVRSVQLRRMLDSGKCGVILWLLECVFAWRCREEDCVKALVLACTNGEANGLLTPAVYGEAVRSLLVSKNKSGQRSNPAATQHRQQMDLDPMGTKITGVSAVIG
jgi:hypothetical protein